jgi:excisionase family DNA binding protein
VVLASFDNVCYCVRVPRAASPKTDLVTVTEAADILGVSPSTLRNWDRAGKLKAKRHPFNDYRLYERRQLERLLKQLSGRR